MNDVFGAVLCAGFGTRLKPLTGEVPKPLIPFLNTPIVAYALHQMGAAGIVAVGLNIHHLADTIPPVVDRLAVTLGVEPTYVREPQIMGTAGGVRGIWEALGQPQGVLVVMNGDSVMNLDLRALVEAHRASGRLATLVVRPKAVDQPGRVFVGGDGMLNRIRHHQRPGAAQGTEHDFCGVHIIDTSLIARLPLENADIITALYGPMVESEEAIGVSVVDSFWAALDTPNLLLDTTRYVLENPDTFVLAPLPGPVSPGLFLMSGVGIDDSVQLASPVLTGLNVTIGAGAMVGPNVCMDGVDVAPGAVIRNAIIFGMGRIEGEWVDCVAIAGTVASASDITPA